MQTKSDAQTAEFEQFRQTEERQEAEIRRLETQTAEIPKLKDALMDRQTTCFDLSNEIGRISNENEGAQKFAATLKVMAAWYQKDRSRVV